VQWGVSPRDIV